MTAILRVSLAFLAMASLVLTAEVSTTSSAATDEPPICDLGGPYGCYVFHSIEFDGRSSYDPDGTIEEYSWDFGDGHSALGAVVTHRYELIDSYFVSLAVVDNSNLSSSCQTVVPISEGCPAGNCPPVCDAAGPYTAPVGTPVLFDGSWSSSPFLCIPIVDYAWSFGDGATGSGAHPSHTYTTAGFYTVALTVTDADGASMSCTTTAQITGPSAALPATWGRIKHWRGQ